MFSCRLVINKVSVSDEGNYCCRAANDLNTEFSNWVEVSVHQPAHGMALPVSTQNSITNSFCPLVVLPQSGERDRPEILTQPPPEVRAQPGQEVRLVVVAHGTDHLNYMYQWYCETNPLPYGTAPELVLSRVTPSDSGTYTCSISSPTGGSVISNPARVFVSPPPPVIPPQPPFSQPHIPMNMTPQYPWVQQPNPENSMGFENGFGSPLPMASPFMSVPSPNQTHELPRHGSVSPPEAGPRGQGRPCASVIAAISSCSYLDMADPTKPCYDKVALLIGNRHYHHGRLKLNTPEADTQDLAGILRSADFKVVSLVNLTKQEMDQVCNSY